MFFVRGVPVPQGAVKAFVVSGKPIISWSSAGLGAWRKAIIEESDKIAPRDPWTVPVQVVLRFVLPRPGTRAHKRKYPHVRPDLDKYVRAVLDAVSMPLGKILKDDSLVVDLYASKVYQGKPRYPDVGVSIKIRQLGDD